MMSTQQKLLIRTDASTDIGSGHLMRCLALAQAWQESGGTVCFAMAWSGPTLEARLQVEGMDVAHLTGVEAGSLADAKATIALAQQQTAAWAVVDGYHFDAAYQHQIKQAGLRLLFIDDYAHASHYYADIVLNQNIYANAEIYAQREPYTRLLLGTEYVLLRREFWPWREWERPLPEKIRKILITLGGSDPDNVTLSMIQVLQSLLHDDIKIVVLAGGQNPHYAQLEKIVSGDERFQLRHNVTDIPEVMASVDLAISAAGSICWELIFMQLPIFLVVTADNQRGVAKALREKSFVCYLGWGKKLNVARLRQEINSLRNSDKQYQNIHASMSQNIDGLGVQRTIQLLTQ